MLPQSFVKNGCSVFLLVDENCGPLVNEAAGAVLQKDAPVNGALSRQWVKRIEMRVDAAGPAWEFDEFSRTAYVCFAPGEVADVGTCGHIIAERAREIVNRLSEWQGIEV
jgi:hypothetical protein